MGFFDNLTDMTMVFKKDDDGKLLFYPRIAFGKGYILPGDEKKEEIHRFVKRYYMVTLPLIFAVGIIALYTKWLYTVPAWCLLMVGLLLWFKSRITQFTKDLSVAEKRGAFTEVYREGAKSKSKIN